MISALLCVVGLTSQQRPNNQIQIPIRLRKHAADPVVVKQRQDYRRLRIAKQSPATFAHVDFSKIKIKGQEADLRQQISTFGLGIRNQGFRGTCSVFALTFCQEYLSAKATGAKNLDFSEEYLNVVGDIAAGSNFDGGFYKDLNEGYQYYGHLKESDLPYHDPIWSSTAQSGKAQLNKGILTTKYEAEFIKNWDPTKGANLAQMKKIWAYLDDGIPVAVGLLWPAQGKMQKKVFNNVDMMIKIPRADTVDGHSVVIVGYRKSVSVPGGGPFYLP